jgi:hypothetical protein
VFVFEWSSSSSSSGGGSGRTCEASGSVAPRSRRAPPGSTKKREWRRQYARFTANYLKARLPDALTLVVGAIRPEAETSREMRGTLAFFDRVTGSADRQEVGGFAAAADSGMVVNDAP